MTLIEVTDISFFEVDHERLWGCSIDLPKPKTQTGGHAVVIEGWVLGRSSPAVAAELVHDGTVIRRTPVDVRRPDIAAGYPDVPGAENSGFRTTASVVGMSELEVQVQ